MEAEVKHGRGKFRLGAVVVLAVAAGAVAWLLLRDNGGSSGVPAGGPEIVSANGLHGLAASVGHPVYWAGPRPGTRLEATKTAKGNVFIRYLDRNGRIGDPRPRFLTVGTYPLANAYGALSRVAKRKGAIVRHGQTGALIVTNTAAPTNVYIAYPSSGIQTEVFDPSAKVALGLAVSGKIKPVE